MFLVRRWAGRWRLLLLLPTTLLHAHGPESFPTEHVPIFHPFTPRLQLFRPIDGRRVGNGDLLFLVISSLGWNAPIL